MSAKSEITIQKSQITNPMKPAKTLLLLLVSLLLTTCQKPSRDNPWDEFADPSAWAPKNLNFTISSPYIITLNWDYSSSVLEGFILERKTNQEAWNVIAPNINPETSYYFDYQVNLDQNDYSYRLRAFATGLFSDYTEISILIPNVTNYKTGKIWMDRNLGASRVAQNITDAEAYGDLYQWGRLTDGHQNRLSSTTSAISNVDVPGHGNFILAPNSPYDWRSPQNNNLWQGVTGTNKPCPPGFRLPTASEWEAERQSWSSNNAEGAFNSPLRLPVAGFRKYSNGSLNQAGSIGYYWSSSVVFDNLIFNSSGAGIGGMYSANGLSVRCIKN